MGCCLSVWCSGTQGRCKGAADTALPFKYSVNTLNLATSGEGAVVFLMALLLEGWCTVLKKTV